MQLFFAAMSSRWVWYLSHNINSVFFRRGKPAACFYRREQATMPQPSRQIVNIQDRWSAPMSRIREFVWRTGRLSAAWDRGFFCYRSRMHVIRMNACLQPYCCLTKGRHRSRMHCLGYRAIRIHRREHPVRAPRSPCRLRSTCRRRQDIAFWHAPGHPSNARKEKSSPAQSSPRSVPAGRKMRRM